MWTCVQCMQCTVNKLMGRSTSIAACVTTPHDIQHTTTLSNKQVYAVLDPPSAGKAGPPPQPPGGGRPVPQHVTSMVALGPDIVATGSSDGVLKVWAVNPLPPQVPSG